jgi:hypothetical protein
MFYTPDSSFNQVALGERLNKKTRLSLANLPIVSPSLISQAAAVARRRECHRRRLDALTLTSLFVFYSQCEQIISELKNMPLHDGYVYEYTGPRNANAYIPADFYYTKVLTTAYRLQTLQDNHQSFLSQCAAIAIKRALDWHLNKCKEMWMAREGLAALAVH